MYFSSDDCDFKITSIFLKGKYVVDLRHKNKSIPNFIHIWTISLFLFELPSVNKYAVLLSCSQDSSNFCSCWFIAHITYDVSEL